MISVNTPWFDGNEKKYLSECIDSGWISSEGPFVKKFEEGFAEKVSRGYGIAVSNGSAALNCALEALNLPAGSEIIVPAATIISCISCILNINCVPVLVDSCAETWNMDISLVAEKITAKTKAIMVVHLYGLPVDMDPIIAIGEKHGLFIIEDAAQQHGQFYKNKPVGSFGVVSVFSFYANKNISTGEGGMVLMNDSKLATRCRSLRNLCFQPAKRFYHEELGHNYRMTNLQAAVGLAQLEQLEKFVCKKRIVGAFYHDRLKDLHQLKMPLTETSFSKNIYWVFGVVITKDCDFTTDTVSQELKLRGIECRPFFYPMHKQPALLKKGLFKGERYPVAENLSEKGFYIPGGSGITLTQQEEVVYQLRSIFR